MTLQQLHQVITIADSGSMNEAAKKLFISQPSLSATVKELEQEIGFNLFVRSNRGIIITPEGEEFLGYARQVDEQYRLLENRYIEKKSKKKFSVSMQHYSFAVKAFVEMVKQIGMDEYEFAVHETRTWEVIENVKFFKSELGVLYLNDYLWGGHPLADRPQISMEELQDYPCLAFDQGKNGAFYFAEEMKSTYDYKQIIHANDRATLLNLMVGLNAYTLCSGIICEELNGSDYKAVPLVETEKMRIGYIKRKGSNISPIGEVYIRELEAYRERLL